MKHSFLTLYFAWATVIMFAQTSEHLSFKGVPIDGTLSEYVSKMKQTGFTLIMIEDGVALLEGDFATYKNCSIGVATIKEADLVSKITVVFPSQKKWSLLASNYFHLKELLTEKYGEPAESIEEFTGYKPESDFSKMAKVQHDGCKYITSYNMDKGVIQLSIQAVHSNAFVMLTYFDKINSEIIRKKAKDDL